MANANTGLIQKQQNTAVANGGKPTMKDLVNKMQGEIARALPSVITPERFTRITLSALSRNPQLAQTTAPSFMGAMMTAAQLGLEPNTPLGQAYLIPFRNKGVLECQFQLGYKGLIDLAYRSGEIACIQAHEVCKNDDFDYSYGLDAVLKHIPALENRGPVVGYYAYFKTKDGASNFEFMSREEAEKHGKKYSKTFGYGPWKDNFDEMAKKTVLKRVLKYAPLKSDFMRAIGADETVKRKSDAADILDEPNEIIIDDNGEVLDYDEQTGTYVPESNTAEE